VALDPKTDDWTIYQGRTFKRIVRWETTPTVFKPITNITQAAPVVVTCVGHGMRSGWYGAITDVLGMTEINAPANAPRAGDYKQVTVVDVDNVSINDLSSAQFSTYTSGGYLRYNTPKSLDGAVARLHVRNRVGGTLLLDLSSTSGEIVLSDLEHVIAVTVSDAVTKLMTYTKGVYDLEIEDSAGETYVLLTGSITVVPEITAEA
jgi:hypothetical protein